MPTLAVHGSNDPIAADRRGAAYAEQIESLSLLERSPAVGHDILNDVTHGDVARTIVDSCSAPRRRDGQALAALTACLLVASCSSEDPDPGLPTWA